MSRSNWRRGRGAVRLALMSCLLAGGAHAHGDVAPQPVNTDALPAISEAWLAENPYRTKGEDVVRTAINIGDSAFNQNCARCHGLGAVSGGLAPDLRFLPANMEGDEWFIMRFQTGYTQNGITKMPAFGELLGQKAAWAIRTYIETRPDEGALTPHTPRLGKIRDQLAAWSRQAPTDGALVATLRQELIDIAAKIKTGSGAPVADSVAARAAMEMNGTGDGFHKAADILTVGLTAAK